MDNKYVLAMYDIRGKQDYIFRSTKIKEIIGGSAIIRDVFNDYLFESAKVDGTEGIYTYKEKTGIIKAGSEFSEQTFEKHIEDENYIGEVVYDGGGNFFVLFKDEDTFNKVTHEFTLRVLAATGSLRVIGTCIGINNFDNYIEDRDQLYKKHRITENQIQNLPLYASAPVVMIDTTTSMPIVERRWFHYENQKDEQKELTHEQAAKYDKYEAEQRIHKDEMNEKVLDRIAPEKGVDSHIAIIYIDGNNMGAKVQTCLEGKKTYEECVNALRKFSDDIQKEFIDSKKAIIDEVLATRYHDKPNDPKRRIVIGAGDEINFICAAKDAYEVAKAYLQALDAEKGFSSCAGIAVFKSHTPYADAYRIAEECCESGKNKMKEDEKKWKEEQPKKTTNNCFLDFHYCQGAIDISIDQIRKDEETFNISRPWLISDKQNNYVDDCFVAKDSDEVQTVAKFLNRIARGNIKGLLEAAKEGTYELEMELQRIKSHQEKKDRESMRELWTFIEGLNKKKKAPLIYDVVLMYDLWFKEDAK